MNLSRLHRPRVLGIAAVAVVAVLAVLIPATPAAASNDGFELVPPPLGYSTPGGPPGGRSTNPRCVNGAWVDDSGMQHKQGPNCTRNGGQVPRPQWTRPNTNLQTCTHAFEVWRFVGTVANPTQAMTVSRTNNLSADCAAPMRNTVPWVPRNFTFPSSPDDSSLYAWVNGSTLSSPYRMYRTNTYTYEHMPRTHSLIAAPNGGISTAATPSVPFRRSTTECTALQGRDPNLSQHFAGGAAYDPSKPNSLAAVVGRQYRHIATNYGIGWANAVFEATPNTVLSNDGNGIPRVGNNDIPCSGAFDFSVESNPAYESNPFAQPNRVVYGTCTVPVATRFSRYVHRSNSNIVMYVPVAQGYRFGWGPETHGVPEYYVNHDPASRPRHNARDVRIVNAFKQGVRNEVGTRWGTTPYPSLHGGPPVGLNATSANAAAAQANCYVDYGNLHAADITPPTPPTTPIGGDDSGEGDSRLPGDAVRLEVNTPNVGQVGGKNRDAAEITTRLAPNPIICDGTPCEVHPQNGPWINWHGPWHHTNLKAATDVNLTLTPPPGMTEGAQDGDWATRPGQAFTPASRGTTAGQGRWGLDFFRATQPGEPYRVTASGTATIWGWIGNDSWYEVCYPSAITGGSQCERASVTNRERLDKEVPLEVVYPNGQEFPVVGPTATPTDRRQN